MSAPRYPGRAQVEAYGNGGFRFAGMSHRGSILCLPSAILAWDGSETALIGALQSDSPGSGLLLIGTGRTFQLPDAGLRAALEQLGVAFEVMDTGAAVRTYNIMFGEGRDVHAALMAVE